MLCLLACLLVKLTVWSLFVFCLFAGWLGVLAGWLVCLLLHLCLCFFPRLFICEFLCSFPRVVVPLFVYLSACFVGCLFLWLLW